MIWSQVVTRPDPGKVIKVTVAVEGWPDDLNRQIGTFVAGLIRDGAAISGAPSTEPGKRRFRMESHS